MPAASPHIYELLPSNLQGRKPGLYPSEKLHQTVIRGELSMIINTLSHTTINVRLQGMLSIMQYNYTLGQQDCLAPRRNMSRTPASIYSYRKISSNIQILHLRATEMCYWRYGTPSMVLFVFKKCETAIPNMKARPQISVLILECVYLRRHI